MFAHFLYARDLQRVTLQGKNQSIETSDIDSVLACPVPFQWMASQYGQSHQFIDVPDLLDRVDAQNVPLGDILTVRLDGLPIFLVTAFQLPGPEYNDQGRILLGSQPAR